MSENIKLEIKKFIKGDRKKVWHALSDPETLKKWSMPGEMYFSNVEMDKRVGGAYKMEIKGDPASPDSIQYLTGTYKKIIPEEELVYTFKGTWQGDVPESLVTFKLKDVPGGTELTLIHEYFTTTETRDNHKLGWESSTDKLVKLFN